MSKWKEMKLLDVTDFIDGDRGKNYPKQFEYLDDGYCLFLNTSNVTIEGFNFDKINYVSKEKDEVLRKGRLEYNDLILTTRGTIGNIAYYEEGMFSPMRINSSMLILRVNNDIVSQSFIYYLIKTKSFREYMNLYSSGSAQPQLPVKDLRQIKIQIPDIKTQEKIADILSIYDELIENNNRRIEILEKTAEEIYKEWFVRMRFPGYKNTKFIKGIPEGWEVKRVGDLGEVITGKTPSTKKEEYYGGNIMFVKTPDMNNNTFVMNTEVYLSKDGSDSQALKLLPKNSIMVNCIGANAGESVSLNIEEAHTNQQINSIVLEDTMYREWVYLTVKNLKEIIKLTAATGATMPNLSKGKFERLKILFSTNETIKEFNNNTKDIFENIKVLMLNNQNLIKQRDLLLPRLMNGTIQVK